MSAARSSSPHVHGPSEVSKVMHQVSLALLPALVAYTWLFGWGVLLNILVAIVVALASEALVMKLRDRPVVATLA
ncbi:MAG: electron transport complex subunit RsxD, partial [Anaerolineae bacterium]|nr:electron transport complex subunit RsxD [Anaerolineae bacterium]